jgi:hypothetical protein
LPGFWIGFLALRLGLGLALRDGQEWVLPVTAWVLVIAIGNLSEATQSRNLGFWLLGAFQGPLLPLLVAANLHLFPGSPACATGWLFGAGTLGCLLLNPCSDWLTKTKPQAQSVRANMRTSLFAMMVWAAAATLLVLVR